MKTRIITALIGLPLVVAALLQPYVWIWAVIAMAASIIGLYEFYKATKISECKSLCVWGFLAAVYFSVWWMYPQIAKLPFALWFTAILYLMMLVFNQKITANKIGLALLSVLYIPYLLTHIIGIRGLGQGEYYIWLVLICAFLTDTFAYFTGKALGRHKLCPNLSPNKTIEGAIGGVIGCGLSCILFGFIISRFGLNVDYLRLFGLGLCGSVGAQLGDLTASAVKRQCGIKDYGNLFPGHGGILDRCDSILFVAPLVYYYIVVIGILK